MTTLLINSGPMSFPTSAKGGVAFDRKSEFEERYRAMHEKFAFPLVHHDDQMNVHRVGFYFETDDANHILMRTGRGGMVLQKTSPGGSESATFEGSDLPRKLDGMLEISTHSSPNLRDELLTLVKNLRKSCVEPAYVGQGIKFYLSPFPFFVYDRYRVLGRASTVYLKIEQHLILDFCAKLESLAKAFD